MSNVLSSNTFSPAMYQSSSSAEDSKQRFSDVLDVNGQYELTGYGFNTLTPHFDYVAEPGDINNQLFVIINSDTSATLKNKGAAENAGKAFKGDFS